ncbi:MAG: hypothetical protein IKN54_07470 [Lachnospiraceae bacterium]|nr:hypothetical protein [Lachnospiraceae bacterium]
MKKNLTIITIIATLLATFLFSSFSKPKLHTVRGTIHSYGAAPLNYPGLKTTKGKEYLIIASDKTKQELLARQAVLIEFTGYIIDDKDELPPNSLKDGAFKIETWETVANKEANKKKK